MLPNVSLSTERLRLDGLRVSVVGVEVTLPHPEGHVHQANKRWHFNERADDTDKCLSRVQTEDGYGHSDCQLKVIANRRKRQGGRLRIICPEPLPHPEADQKHDEKVNDQRDCNMDYVERQTHYAVILPVPFEFAALDSLTHDGIPFTIHSGARFDEDDFHESHCAVHQPWFSLRIMLFCRWP